jgi:hypothetical protein
LEKKNKNVIIERFDDSGSEAETSSRGEKI